LDNDARPSVFLPGVARENAETSQDEDHHEKVKGSDDQHPEQSGLGPVGLVQLGVAAEGPDKQHDEIDQRDGSDKQRHQPFTDANHCFQAGCLLGAKMD